MSNGNVPVRKGRYHDLDKMDATMMADGAMRAEDAVIAEDAVFTIMATGQEHRGREAVVSMLDYYFHIAFDATAVTRNCIFADQQAIVEGTFEGKHIGEFAGIPATHKQVCVPLVVVYDLEGDQIKRGRIYLEMFALSRQLKGTDGMH